MKRGAIAASWAEQDLAALQTRGLRRILEPLASAQGARVRIGAEELINFSSNDYLGLTNDPRLAEAAKTALDRFGTGTGASRLVVGDTELHQQLERRLAAFMHAPSAMLFNSGYAANVGILQALLGPEDVVFSDALNHASLIDGCRLSRARTVIYPHGDVAALDRLLRDTPGRRHLVCTDAVFSMDGDRAPLTALVDACERHGAALFVDEAHAIGVLGSHGRGLSAELGVEQGVDIRMGTLGKAFGGFGAFAVASEAVTQLFVNRSRSLVFSTAFPAAWCAVGQRAAEIIESEPQHRERLDAHIHRMSDGLRALGVAAQPASAVFSVILGTPEKAVETARRLRARGLLTKPIRPPTVPPGTSRLRLAVSAAHRPDDVDLLLSELRHVI
jgi:8-amino-7-oxononanoate synthase